MPAVSRQCWFLGHMRVRIFYRWAETKILNQGCFPHFSELGPLPVSQVFPFAIDPLARGASFFPSRQWLVYPPPFVPHHPAPVRASSTGAARDHSVFSVQKPGTTGPFLSSPDRTLSARGLPRLLPVRFSIDSQDSPGFLRIHSVCLVQLKNIGSSRGNASSATRNVFRAAAPVYPKYPKPPPPPPPPSP